MVIKIVRNQRQPPPAPVEQPVKPAIVDDLRFDLGNLQLNDAGSPEDRLLKCRQIFQEICNQNPVDSAQMKKSARLLTELCSNSQVLSLGFLDDLKRGLQSKASKAWTLLCISHFMANLQEQVEPYLIPLFPLVLECVLEKSREIHSSTELATRTMIQFMHPEMCSRLLPTLVKAIDPVEKAVKRKLALEALSSLCSMNMKWTKANLPDLIPIIARCMTDIHPEVQNCAQFKVMPTLCNAINNRDLTKVLPLLVEAAANYEKVPECIKVLYGVVFVKDLDRAALAMMIPILCRVLNDRNSTVLYRQASVIVGNMCKLIVNQEDIVEFLPLLVPGLEKVSDSGSDPELREVATASLQTVRDLLKQTKTVNGVHKPVDKFCDVKSFVTPIFAHLEPTAQNYLIEIVTSLAIHHHFDADDWISLSRYIVIQDEHPVDFSDLREKCFNIVKDENEDLHSQDHETLCNVSFNLGYGGMILLKDAKLELKRGSIYGIVGKNGCGKSTLMKAIANEQLDGFPPKSEVNTVYVSHTFQGLDFHQSVIDFVRNEFPDISESQMNKTLREFGFDDSLINQQIAALSGGWKMKLELVMAALKNADILLLDEPTNHLDVANCIWLEKYLVGNTKLTVMLVSHDAGFLDAVCSHIIHYHNLQLRTYKSDFSKFREMVPEARSYLEYQQSDFIFNFPNPGNLDAVKSANRTILRLSNVNYIYPGSEKPTLFNINLRVSLGSRIAIIGPNGAGKSTMIKILTGEMYPSSGKVQKHASLRIAYIAQHAFHHLEQHLEQAPCEYIRWRFESGLDKELLAKETRSMSQLELNKRDELAIECICGRQKLKRTHQYEIKLIGHGFDETKWMTREELEQLGFKSMIQAYDDLEAARGGSHGREVTLKAIEDHLKDFGLDPEIGTHGTIKGLSGGQKVKVVLAAAMWLRPHIVVMDEPTNYLDIQSLDALSGAIKKFKGGVVVISHNSNFVDGCCTDFYEMRAGHLNKKNLSQDMDSIDADAAQEDDSHLVDAKELERNSNPNGDENKDSDAQTDQKKKPVVRQKKETRRQRLLKDKIKAAKLLKYGPKPDGTEYSSEEEVETNINIGSIN